MAGGGGNEGERIRSGRVAVLGEPMPDELSEALRASGLAWERRELNDGDSVEEYAALLLFESALTAEALETLHGVLQRQRPWSLVPVIAALPGGACSPQARAVLGDLGYVAIVSLDHAPDLLAEALRSAVLRLGPPPGVPDEEGRRQATCRQEIFQLFRDEREARLRSDAASRDTNQELRAAWRQLRDYLASSPLGVVEWDAEYRILTWTGDAPRMFGWTAEEVLGRGIFEIPLVYDEDRERVSQLLADMAAGRSQRNVNRNRNCRKDGSALYCEWYNSPLFDETGAPVSVLGLVLDVTERQTVETERTRQLARSVTLVQVSREIMAERSPTGLLQRVAGAACTITDARFGVAGHGDPTGHFVLSQGCGPEGVPPSCPVSLSFMSDRGFSGKLLRTEAVFCLTQDELERHPAWRGLPPGHVPLRGLLGAPLTGGTGEQVGLVMTTDRRDGGDFAPEDAAALAELAAVASLGLRHLAARSEAERRAQEAEQASQAKSQFLANMSHEIRTPMNAVLEMTELALLEEVPAKVREYLEHVKRSAKSLLEIVNDVLDLSRIEAGRIELLTADFDLRASVGAVLSTLSVLAAEKGLRLSHRIDARVPRRILGDRGRLDQVLVNIVGNAVKFTDRGEISLDVWRADLPEDGEAGPRLLFEVRDTGIGIPPDKLDAIFGVFEQAGSASNHARYGGAGLGLSISRRLVELMGGSIWAESKLGRGSAFRFTIAVRIPEAELAVERAQSEGPPASRPLRVLLAEDNPVNQLLGKALLERDGHEVVVVEDGRKALEALAREPFDLVLMDVRMPEVDGEEATRLVREGAVPTCPRDLPIVALTAHALAGDRERFLSAGMDAYLPKPIELQAFRRVLAEVAARRRGVHPESVGRTAGTTRRSDVREEECSPTTAPPG